MNLTNSSTNSSQPCEDFLLFLYAEVSYLLAGLPLHGYVLWLMVTTKTVASEYFALTLTLCELLFCVGTPIMEVVHILTGSQSASLIVILSYGFVYASRPLFQCCICVERYLAVVRPMAFLKYRPLRYRVACSAVVWVAVAGVCGATAAHAPDFPVVELTILSVVLLSVNLFCSLSILWTLKRPGPGEAERGRDGGSEGMNILKKKAFITISVFLVLTLLDHVPFIILNLLSVDEDLFWLLIACVAFVFNTCGLVPSVLQLRRLRSATRT